MKIRQQSYLRFILGAVAIFVVGLAIGATQGGDKTALNTVSAILLTVGVIAFVALVVLEVVRRTRLRTAAR